MLLYASVVLLLAPTLFIFFWTISLSLKSEVENTAYPPVFVPARLDLANYVSVFAKNPFLQFALNSFIVALGSTGLALLFGTLAAYAIARWNHPHIALAILAVRLVPGLSFLLPWFIFFRALGLSGSHASLVLTHTVVSLPVVTWLMIGFFEDLNPELEAAALVDGCGPFGAFARISLPLALPGLLVSGILAFILSWNNFVYSIVLGGPQTRTLPVAIFNMIGFEQIAFGPLAAAALIVTLPVLILTLFVQRYIVAGLAAGALKG
jgi:multiple sugar transport system permease protein